MAYTRRQIVSFGRILTLGCALGMFILGGCGTPDDPAAPGDKPSGETGAKDNDAGDKTPGTETAKKPAEGDSPLSDLDLATPATPAIPETTTEVNIVEEEDNSLPKTVVGNETQTIRYTDKSRKRVFGIKKYSNFNPAKPAFGSWEYDGDFISYYQGATNKASQTPYKDGLPEGEWKYWYPNGKLCKSGQYTTGKLDGQWRYWREDGTMIMEENYKNGKIDGTETRYNADGKTPKSTRQFSAGIPDGAWTVWYSPEQKQAEEHYKKGKRDGTLKAWNEKGVQILEASFKDGVRHGTVKTWDDEGKIKETIEYVNGIKKG